MQHRRRQRGRRVVRENPHRINDFIRVSEVRLVGDNVEMGVYSTDKAKDLARELELDLVEISPNAEPPVCKIMDYRKFLFEKKNKAKHITTAGTELACEVAKN